MDSETKLIAKMDGYISRTWNVMRLVMDFNEAIECLNSAMNRGDVCAIFEPNQQGEMRLLMLLKAQKVLEN